MRVADLYEQKAGKPIISFELSRPKNEKAAAKLDKALEKMREAEPDYLSVTFGAGGSSREGSFELVDKLANEKGFDVVAYLACVGMAPSQVTACLDKFATLGVETLFAIRGDPPTWDETYQPHPEALAHASDLLKVAKEQYQFCLGAAAHPEGHIEAVSPEKDLEYLKLKVANGADYIVAQYFYDNAFFFDFLDRARASGISVPIFPGIMPIYNVKLMNSLAEICGATIADKVRQGLSELPDGDKKAVSQFGIRLATEQCRDLLEHGVDGLHFYTMNRAKSVTAVVGALRSEGLL